MSVLPIRGGSSVDALGEVVGVSIVMAYLRRVNAVHVVFAIVIATILATPVGVAVYSSQTVALMAGSGVRDMFSFVSVSLRVLDADGNPINRAQVKAYSEDWFARYTDSMMGEPGFALTDIVGG